MSLLPLTSVQLTIVTYYNMERLYRIFSFQDTFYVSRPLTFPEQSIKPMKHSEERQYRLKWVFLTH